MFDWQPLTHSCEWRVAVYLNSMASDFPLDDSCYSNDQKSINLRTEKCKNGIFIILLVLFSHQGYKSQFFLCSCCFRFNILILKVWNYFTFVFACGYKRWPSLLENIFVQNASNANKISSHKLLLATLEPHWQVYFWTQERRKKHSIADGLTMGEKGNKMKTSVKILPLPVENVILTHLLSVVKSTPLIRPHSSKT